MDSIPYMKIKETCEKVFRGKYRIFDEDVIYDTMTSIIIQYKKNSTHIRSLDAWLYGAIHHHYCTYVKVKNKKKMFTYDSFIVSETNGYETFPESKLDVDSLKSIIAELEEPYSKILELRIFEGFSHKEIAKKLEIKEATVRKYYSRSLKKVINVFKVVSQLIVFSYLLLN